GAHAATHPGNRCAHTLTSDRLDWAVSRPAECPHGAADRHPMLGKGLVRDPEAVHGGRHSGIDRDLQKYLADLRRRHPIGEGAANVDLELMRAVEDTDHCEVQHAALLAIQSGTPPDLTPAILGDEFLQRRVETVDAGEGTVHVLLAQHGLADPQALFVAIICHAPSPWRRGKHIIRPPRDDPPFGWR